MLRSLSIATSRMKINCFHQRFFDSFPALQRIQVPAPRETHIWYVMPNEVKNEILLNQYLEILSPSEKETVFQMRDEKLKKRALIARVLVRTTISRYQINSEVSPRSLKFRKNIHGKPEVDWQHSGYHQPLPLHFNISHTSSLIACGVTTYSPIGIDVEEKHRAIKHNILSFARRYLSKHEIQFLSSISDPKAQQQEFIKLWTLKEAYVKALGRGFSGAPFKTFTIRIRDATQPNLGVFSSEASEVEVDPFDDPTLTSNWKFILLELIGSHYAAICTRRDFAAEGKLDPPIKLTVWKTIPFVEDTCVSGTDAIMSISGLP
ncbi:hypothetical protein M9H77_24041 [Catharanthus roseus]|uniref:Uncharacterized protein n=1 Tax=Catharanthus roseus TaxID=4058 RepID=A0ACC0AZ51_CATRO|nr:hypothetical protein M9H77_24041 [Catharanthus roseus]